MKLFVTSLLIVSATSASADVSSTSVASPSLLSGKALSTTALEINWKDNSSNESGFEVERVLGTSVKITRLPAQAVKYSDSGLVAGTKYNYRVRSYLIHKTRTYFSGYTPVYSVTTLSPPPPPAPAPVPVPPPAPAPVPAPNPVPSPVTGLKAFPTAEGFGAKSVGGRGGKLFIVSTLNDAGAGSLRECVDAVGPRICSFNVSGTILLDSALAIKNPNITIAGQSSPGGIQLRNRNNLQSPILVDANDVIIRHLRLRPGPSVATSDLVDAITVGSKDKAVARVIIDHVSMSWSTDELIQTGPSSSDLTVQWSLIYEGLSKSTHVSGEHSKGPFLKGNRATFHMNYIAHNTRRTPNITSASVSAHQVDMINNIFYNSREAFGEIYDEHGKANVNFVGNMFQMGPETFQNLNAFYADYLYANSGKFGFSLFVKDNIDPNRKGLATEAENLILPVASRTFVVSQPVGQGLTAPAYPVKQAALDLLAFAGATVPKRDSQDSRVVSEFFNCQGNIIDNPSEVGGWPAMGIANAPLDTDKDGMSDAWEDLRKLNKLSSADMNGDDDKDGYTNIEEYLNELAGDELSKIGKGLGILPAHRCGR